MAKRNLDEATIIASLSVCQKNRGDDRFINLMEYLEDKKENSNEKQYDKRYRVLAMRYCVELIRIFYDDEESQAFGVEMPEKTEKQFKGKNEWLDCVLAIWGLSDGYQEKQIVETKKDIFAAYRPLSHPTLKDDSAVGTISANIEKGYSYMAERLSLILNAKPDKALHLLDQLLTTGDFDKDKNYTFVYPKPYYEALLPKEEPEKEPVEPKHTSESEIWVQELATPNSVESESEAEQKPITKRKVIRWASAIVGAAAFLTAVVVFLIQNVERPSETADENITYDLSYEDGDDAGALWGDSDGGRLTYTKSEMNAGVLGERITFNSFKDGEFGDERNFVGAALVSGQGSVWYGNDIEVEDGQTYVICLYVHNDNPDGLNVIAEDVRVRFELPITVSKIHEVTGYIESSNTEPDQYWDGVTLYSSEEFYLEYVEGSAIYQNDGMGAICLTEDIIVNGAPIGYDRFDGKLPGGRGYEGIVTIKVVAHTSVTTSLSLAARLKGTSYWTDGAYANIGDEVEFQIKYRNLTSDTVNNVMIRDILPNNMEYVSGSTVLYNSNYQDGVSIIDDTAEAEGINIGSYASAGNAYVRFSAKVVDDNLANGLNQLVNWASATVDSRVYKDDVSILVTKK